MNGKSKLKGHILALLCILVWGGTYVASDYLLQYYTSLQLLLLRFILAYLILLVIRPSILPVKSVRQELSILLLAMTGVLFYYILETMAIRHGGATNISILISSIPIWTLLLLCLTTKQTMHVRHVLGFLLAIAGVVLVVYNGAAISFTMNSVALLYAIGACLCWAIYSLQIEQFNKVDAILLTRRMLFYSLIFIIPMSLLFDGMPSFQPLLSLPGAASLALLGIFGSAFSYVWWKQAITHAGVVNATNYIYLTPFVTMAVAIILRTESVTVLGAVGSVLIIVGIILSGKS